jgi:hypothetical protein
VATCGQVFEDEVMEREVVRDRDGRQRRVEDRLSPDSKPILFVSFVFLLGCWWRWYVEAWSIILPPFRDCRRPDSRSKLKKRLRRDLRTASFHERS